MRKLTPSHALICTAALLIAPLHHAARAATTYDAVRDFTTKANPNGVWS